MRITTLIIGIQACFSSLLLANETKAQNVSIDVRKTPVIEIFKTIEKQTGVTFTYNESTLKALPALTIKAINKQLDAVLKEIEKQTSLQFRQQGNLIGVSRGKQKEQPKIALPPQKLDVPILFLDITGKVVDEKGRPLGGASVKLKNGTQATSTDASGVFHLNSISINSVLIVSFIGYQPKEVTVTALDANIVIMLGTSVSKLDEVLVIPYGTTTERLNTGSISSVTSEDIERQPVSNPLAALEGRVPGLIITQSSGLPGSTFTVNIRGRTSIANSSDPLYLIDGVPFNANGLDLVNGGVGPSGQSPFNSINPEDIESIEVLKDASATAIYGSRGANGVILITTKKGKAGKTKVTASVYSGAGTATRTANYLSTSQYLQMRHEAFKNDSISPNASNAPDLYSWDTTRNTNWKKMLIGGTAKTTDAQANISGGDALTQFLVGTNYHRETTVFPGDLSDSRINVHMNLTHTSPDKKFNLTLTASYSNDVNHLISQDLTQYINTPPDAPSPYDANGKLNWSENGVDFANPLSYLYQPYTANTDNLVSNAVLEYKILPGLSIRTNLGYTSTTLKQTQLDPTSAQNPDNGPVSTAIFGNNSAKTWIIEPQAEYRKEFGKNSFDVLLGGSWEQDVTAGIVVNATGYSNDALLSSPAAAGSVISAANYTQYRYQAIFGRISYNYNSEYVLDLTGRRDGSSRFGPGKQFANFGALGAAWVFTEENWFKNNVPFLSDGKLRGSYGVTGNDKIGDYQYLQTYSPTIFPYQGTSGVTPTSLSNPDYAWEINKKTEFALDLGFFKDRLNINADYFINRSSNQLIEYTLPEITGFSGILENFPAIVQNSGFEFVMNSVNIKSTNFKWTSSFNISFDRNKLVSFPGLSTSTYADQYIVGQPLNIYKGLQFMGVNAQTGVYQFNGTAMPADQTGIENLNPRFYGGLQNTFSYKGIQLDLFFQFVKQQGLNYYGTFAGTTAAPGAMYNQPDLVLGRWQNPGDLTSTEKFTTSGSNTAAGLAYYYFSGYSTGKFSDASFIRLKNASISYSIPPKWVKKIGADNLRVYLQAQNFLTFTKYQGNDPESGSLNGSYLPPLKVITAGIQFTY